MGETVAGYWKTIITNMNIVGQVARFQMRNWKPQTNSPEPSGSQGIFAIYLGLKEAQDCSALLGSNGRKRFFLDDIANSFNNLPKQVTDILPGHPEVDRRCSFETLKTLYNDGYSICVGCSQVSSDHGRCHSIEVCRKGSSCIQGRNENRIPSYYWHGCCEDTDPNCKSGLFNLDVSNRGQHYNLPYRKTVCKGPVCNENGYTSQKNDLINKLVGTTQAPAVTTQAPPQTTPAPAGPVNGGYTSWSIWGACDKSCDIGVRFRTRACTNPVPSNGGTNCVGPSKQTELCNVNPCSK